MSDQTVTPLVMRTVHTVSCGDIISTNDCIIHVHVHAVHSHINIHGVIFIDTRTMSCSIHNRPILPVLHINVTTLP